MMCREGWVRIGIVALAAASIWAGCSRPEVDGAAGAESGGDGRFWAVESAMEGSGEGRVLVARVTPRAPYKINVKYDWAMEMDPASVVAAGETLSRDRARRLTDDVAEFAIPAPGGANGTAMGTVTVSVCRGEDCLVPRREPVSWLLQP